MAVRFEIIYVSVFISHLGCAARLRGAGGRNISVPCRRQLRAASSHHVHVSRIKLGAADV